MGFFLQIEVQSPLAPCDFREKVTVPLGEALEREGLGRVLDGAEDELDDEGQYQLYLEVTDQQRASEIVQDVLKSVSP